LKCAGEVAKEMSEDSRQGWVKWFRRDDKRYTRGQPADARTHKRYAGSVRAKALTKPLHPQEVRRIRKR